jgi:hypothetical protein
MAIRLASHQANYRFAYPRDANGGVARPVLSIFTVFLRMKALSEQRAVTVSWCVSVRTWCDNIHHKGRFASKLFAGRAIGNVP